MRRFSTSASRLVRAATQDKVPFRERDAATYQWLQGEGAKYANTGVTESRYLGNDRPFPKNPQYVPVAPLTDKVKEAIFAKYIQNPNRHQPRQLAQQFGLEIRRVEAIIRMKHEERQLRESADFNANRTFTTKMEQLLSAAPQKMGSSSYSLAELDGKESESKSAQGIKGGRPIFATAIAEEEHLPSSEAKKFLAARAKSHRVHLPSHSKNPGTVSTTLPILSKRSFSLEKPSNEVKDDHYIERGDPAIIEDLKFVKKRNTKWMIVDTSYTSSDTEKARKVKIRFADGSLRLATDYEKDANLPWVMRQEEVKNSRMGKEKVLPIYKHRC